MNICYVANSRFPSERAHMTQIVQMCNAFALNGHSVTLLVTDRKTDIREEAESFFGTKFLFEVVRIPVPDIAGFSPKIPKIFRPSTFLIQRFLFAYRSSRYINTHNFDLVYGRDEWILWFLMYLTSIPAIWESHEAKFSYIARSLIRRLKRIIVISEGIQNFYISHGVFKNQIHVAHDAVDARFFEQHVSQNKSREILGISTKKPVVMYIGGLDVWKGVTTLFDAARNQESFDVYVVGGKDNELSEFRNKYPHIYFLGPRPYKELPICQQSADILVIPNTAKNSLSSEYTSPLKLFAHMTSKKPIIASRIPSITNILFEQEAFFFTADDSRSLYDTVIATLREPDVSVKKAQAAYQKSFQYTWNARAAGIIEFASTKK